MAKALGKNIHVGNRRPLAEGDPAAATVRHADGVAEPARRRYPSAEELLLGYSAPPAEPEPEAEVAAEAVAPTEATPGGMRLVGGLSGGGGVWERVRPGSRSSEPEAA